MSTFLVAHDHPRLAVAADLPGARKELAQAHAAQARKDNPSARDRVVAAQARMDGLLDLYLALA